MRRRGFTILELVIAISIFVFLGTAIVFMMRQALSIFAVGSTDAALQDRADTVLPLVRRNLQRLSAGAAFDPPPPAPDPKSLAESRKTIVPPPPVDVRMRAGTLLLDFPSTDPRHGTVCPYFAFVVANGAERRDPRLRRPAPAGVQGKDYVPEEVDRARDDAVFKPTGGLMEYCYIAAPLDPDDPLDKAGSKMPWPAGVLTLYEGFRAPIGGPDSLLDPRGFVKREELVKRCRPVEQGLLHFGATWRNAFATSWDTALSAGVGETDALVSTTWDSTRALDPTFRLFKGADSLGDPSDDRFPSAVRLEVVLAIPTNAGFRRGETDLAEGIDAEGKTIAVSDVDALLNPRSRLDAGEGMLKVGSEWMRYTISATNPDPNTRKVMVFRGQRGTKAVAHERGAMVYLGLPSRLDLPLRVRRDAYAQGQGGVRAPR
jgi:prepilin-type N-terminal cleavage/methylation domain-containing protein